MNKIQWSSCWQLLKLSLKGTFSTAGTVEQVCMCLRSLLWMGLTSDWWEHCILIFTGSVLILFDQTSRFISVRKAGSSSACKKTHYSRNIHTIVERVEQNMIHKTTGALEGTLSLSHYYADSLSLQEESNNSKSSLFKRMAISSYNSEGLSYCSVSKALNFFW
jgi:hypothetical protein